MTLTINPAATVSAGSAQTICEGSTATMNGSFGGGASSATWSSSGTGSFNNNNVNAIYTPSAADISAGSVSLTYTTNDPAGPCGAVNASMTLGIEPIATVNAGIDQSICSSSTVTLAGSFGGSATGGTWTTSGDGTFNSASSMTAVYTPGTTDITNGTVTLTLASTGTVACSASDNMVVRIYSSIPAQPGAISGAPTSICPPQTGITLTTANDPNAASYTWYLAPGNNGVTFTPVSTTNTQIINIGTTSNSGYAIRVTATNACGTSVYGGVYIRRSVSVPTAVIGNTVACAGNTYGYSIAAVGGADNYTWVAPAGSDINSSGSTLTTTATSVNIELPSGFTTGTISVAANVACFTSAYKSLTVKNSTPALGLISGVTQLCPGVAQPFAVVPVTGAASYSWTKPSNVSGSSSSNTISATSNASFSNGNLCVTATSICGVVSAPRCKSLATGVPPRPSVINGQTNGLCSQTTVYTAPSLAGVSYSWTLPSGATGSSSTNSISATMPNNLSTGQVCVQTTNSCGTSLSRCISVKGAPNTPASISALPGSWCANTSGIEFLGNVSNVTGAYSLNWSWVPASAASYVLGQGTNDIIVDWNSGNATVYLTSSNSCGTGTRTYVVNVGCREAHATDEVASDENTSIAKVIVAPNPATDAVNVSFNTMMNDNVNIKLMDITGKVMMTKTINADNGYNRVTFAVNNFAKGVYMVVVENSKGITKNRLVIQ
jgi:hypothetical protein